MFHVAFDITADVKLVKCFVITFDLEDDRDDWDTLVPVALVHTQVCFLCSHLPEETELIQTHQYVMNPKSYTVLTQIQPKTNRI